MSGPLRSGVFTLGLANALALLAAVGATALYARWLDATTFAHWAMALALARAGLLLLDGGLKTALVRRADEPDRATLRRLSRLSGVAALLLVGGAGAAVAWLWSRGQIGAGPALLLWAYPAAYLLTYPPLFSALARLERAQRFAAVGRAEGASVALEFVLPALLLAAGADHWVAFVAAAWVARAMRTAWVLRAARALHGADAGTAPAAASTRLSGLLNEGAGMQAVAALSMARDQMHLWLLAPAFGAAAAGQYALALTACALATQVAVATASRVLLPVMRAAEPSTLWPLVLSHSRALAAFTLPALALLPAWLAQLDVDLWGGRWHEAVALVPWLALRMLAGVGTTVLGAWMMVVRQPWHSARAHAVWTLCEIAVASIGLALAGPLGMAIGSAVAVWAGLWCFLVAAQPQAALWSRWKALVWALVARPSAWCALALAAWVQVMPQALLAATLALPLCWLTEAPVRRWLRLRASALHARDAAL